MGGSRTACSSSRSGRRTRVGTGQSIVQRAGRAADRESMKALYRRRVSERERYAGKARYFPGKRGRGVSGLQTSLELGVSSALSSVPHARGSTVRAGRGPRRMGTGVTVPVVAKSLRSARLMFEGLRALRFLPRSPALLDRPSRS